MESKVCPSCKIEKPLATGFYKLASLPDGVSTHCMVCKRAKTREFDRSEKGKERIRRRDAKARKVNPHKLRAGLKVREAVRTGKLVKPDSCPNCGSPERLEGHHEDYSKPLDVIWLCNICHKGKHGRLVAVDLIERTDV